MEERFMVKRIKKWTVEDAQFGQHEREQLNHLLFELYFSRCQPHKVQWSFARKTSYLQLAKN